ncbi:hypothetical protein [Amycolatopsis benzoatilytica]|uniref:hypothetical protein n=1 Tax=Amycolatopsis benzoatilytica TaxID=346045 RepID=UPI0003754732|nr:hypothetical protein [Amycolatopsis benzoatilytica]
MEWHTRARTAFRIGGTDLRIVRTADSVQAIAAAGTGRASGRARSAVMRSRLRRSG